MFFDLDVLLGADDEAVKEEEPRPPRPRLRETPEPRPTEAEPRPRELKAAEPRPLNAMVSELLEEAEVDPTTAARRESTSELVGFGVPGSMKSALREGGAVDLAKSRVSNDSSPGRDKESAHGKTTGQLCRTKIRRRTGNKGVPGV